MGIVHIYKTVLTNIFMVRILAFGDIHSDKRKARELAKQAKDEKVDLVILTGDLTYNDDLSGIIGPFSAVGVKVLVIHGNHEDSSCLNVLEELYDNAKSIHGKYHIHDYVGFFGSGGADCYPIPTSESDIEKMLNKAHDSLMKNGKNLRKKVLISHQHPRGSKSEFSGFVGSKSVRHAIEKFRPDLALFSHIHEGSGMEDTIGNSRALNVSRKSFIIDI